MSNTPEILFRSAVPEDAERLAAFQIAAWKEHYREFLPRWTLDQVSLEDRREAWRMILRNPERHADTEVLLAETRAGIAGFGAVGRQRSQRLAGMGYGGDVSAIYVGTRFQSQGLGRRILARLFAHLRHMGENRASLWVIRDNKAARRFAEATGAEILDPGAGGRYHAIDDIAYGWRRLNALSFTPWTQGVSGHDRKSVQSRPALAAPFEYSDTFTDSPPGKRS